MPHPGASCQFRWSCPSPQQIFCTILVVYHTLPVSGGPLAGTQGGREPRGRRYRCAGACGRNFWLASAKGACSPPGQRPNGMAGWLPAIALIAASLRFEVTRSFQSFTPTLIRARDDAGPAAAPPPLPARAPLCREKLFCFLLGARTAPALGKASLLSNPRWQEGTCQRLGDTFTPAGLFCSSRCHSGDQEHPPTHPEAKNRARGEKIPAKASVRRAWAKAQPPAE